MSLLLTKFLRRLVVVFLVLVFASAAFRVEAQSPVVPASYAHYAVVCQSPEAARVGSEILARGGNSVDAAVATAFAMAVAYPAAGNIGGGGFLVLYAPGAAAPAGGADLLTSYDFREKAPAGAHPKMFLDDAGNYDRVRHHSSHVAVGVLGSVAGLALAHSGHGRLPWKAVVLPAVALARDGFPLSVGLAHSLASVVDSFQPPEVARAIFTVEGRPLKPGERLIQRDLADTLERIANVGPREFYGGRTAALVVTEMMRGGGLITAQDLADYRAVERPPISCLYRGHVVVAMGPPSSGGVALAEMFGILEGFDLSASGAGSAKVVHLLAESMRRAFADRARYLGDIDHVDVPISRLTDGKHTAALRATISPRRASKSSPERFSWPRESEETTHISVVDRDGMAVSLTTTIEQSYGARIIVPGAGFLLNNQMGDFNAAPDLTTRNGLIGTPPNLAAPEKRMLSSMTPTVLLKAEPDNDAKTRRHRLVGVLGTPGGRTIINSVLGVIIHLIDFGKNIQEAVDAPRVHHQWLPDVLWLEPGSSPDAVALLRGFGHDVRVRAGAQGSVMGITGDPRAGRLEVGVDRRRYGAASAGR